MPKKKFAFSKASKKSSDCVAEAAANNGQPTDDKIPAAATASIDHAPLLGDNKDDRYKIIQCTMVFVGVPLKVPAVTTLQRLNFGSMHASGGSMAPDAQQL